MMKHKRRWIRLLLTFLLLILLCACGAEKNEKSSDKDSKTKRSSASNKTSQTNYEVLLNYEVDLNYSSILDYAEKLEEAGNAEAAAAVYEIIIKNGGAGLIKDVYENNQFIKESNEINAYMELFGRKGDDGK